MKKSFPLILRLIVLCLTYSFYFISEQINYYVSHSYDIKPRMIAIPLIVIVIAVLFALSVFKFKLEDKVQKIVFTVVISVFALAILLYPIIGLMWQIPYYAISIIDFFVCTAYIVELIVNRKQNKD